ncbi:hypothetical protein SBA2_240039 [Acidobacteriia bacterium SbA2]|nr:hypothetical protein SBA2_240039 [Acidobacteriia bacterium SbA2]
MKWRPIESSWGLCTNGYPPLFAVKCRKYQNIVPFMLLSGLRSHPAAGMLVILTSADV